MTTQPHEAPWAYTWEYTLLAAVVMVAVAAIIVWSYAS